MGEAFLDYKKGGSGGLDINGIIQDYYVYAGENVNAGDFVEFVNGVAGQTTETSEEASVSSTAYHGYKISACKLSETSVFIAHGTDDAVSQSYLHGVVCKIEGTKIISGVSTQISSNRYSARSIVTITLDKDRVLVLHSYNDNYRLYSSICEISGTTISVTATKQLSSTGDSGTYVSACKLSETKIFITHGDSTSNNRLYGVVATVSGTTITAGTDTQLSTNKNTSSRMSTVSLSANKVCIAHSYDSTNMYLYGMVCTVSGTTISHGTDTALQKNTWAGGTISAEALDGNRVFIAHKYSNYGSLYSMVCTISGTSITAGTDTTISGLTDAEEIVSTILLKNGDVFIAHSLDNTSGYSLGGIVCQINGTIITHGTDVILNSNGVTGNAISSVLLDNGNIFIAHSYSSDYLLYAQIFGIDEANNIPTNNVTLTEYETQVRPTTSLPCGGVASTSGEGGDETGHKDVVSVFLPLSFYNQFNLITNGDFSNGLEGWTLTSSAFSQLTAETGGYEGNCAKVTITNPPTYASSCNLENAEFNLYANHVYYISFLYKGFKNNVANMNAGISLFNSSLKAFVTSTSNFTEGGDLITWQKRSAYGTNSEDGKGYVTLYTSIQNHDITITEGMAICYDNIRCYDLTAIFGVGNEPTQEWCDANL